MPFKFFSLFLLLLFASSLVAEAQPLRLGSSREQVMKEVHRSGAHSDTLRKGSPVISWIWTNLDSSFIGRYTEVIRIAPVRMFEMEGYAAFVFDTSGGLDSYTWSRQDMRTNVLRGKWDEVLTWTNDVSQQRYNRLADSLKRVSPPTNWTDSTRFLEARMYWFDSSEVRRLTWTNGALMYKHGPR